LGKYQEEVKSLWWIYGREIVSGQEIWMIKAKNLEIAEGFEGSAGLSYRNVSMEVSRSFC
jgi:hypothetical protein